MSRWADYLVTDVHYDATRKFIERARVCLGNDMTRARTEELSRDRIFERMRRGLSFYTARRNTDGSLYECDWVRPLHLPNEPETFLRTDSDFTPSDNFGVLPEF